MSAEQPSVELERMLEIAELPPRIGLVWHNWERQNDVTTRSIYAGYDIAGSMSDSRRVAVFTRDNVSGQDFYQDRENEPMWLLYELDAMPPPAFQLELAIRTRFQFLHTYPSHFGVAQDHPLLLNPESGLIVARIPWQSYLQDDQPEPGVLSPLVAPLPEEYIRGKVLMVDHVDTDAGVPGESYATGWIELDIALDGLGDMVREDVENGVEDALKLAFRFGFHPDADNTVPYLHYVDGNDYNAETWFMADIALGDGGGFDPAVAPRLVMTMSCPSDDGDGDGGGGGIGDSRTASSRRRRDRLPEHSLEAFLQSVAEPPVRLTGKVRQDDE